MARIVTQGLNVNGYFKYKCPDCESVIAFGPSDFREELIKTTQCPNCRKILFKSYIIHQGNQITKEEYEGKE